jgi:hypothetical protein
MAVMMKKIKEAVGGSIIDHHEERRQKHHHGMKAPSDSVHIKIKMMTCR